MMSFDLILVGGTLTLAVLFFFYVTHKSLHLIDRLTDKIMAERSPQAFVNYATTTPTVKDEQFRPAEGNGKLAARTPGQDELPSYLEIP